MHKPHVPNFYKLMLLATVALLTALRSALATATTDHAGDNYAAERELLDVLGAGFADLADKGAGIAAKADGHASDTLTLQSA